MRMLTMTTMVGWTLTNCTRFRSILIKCTAVEGFELIIPGTQVSLGAWDIIGIFTGVPLAMDWVGLLTRVERGRRYEDELETAESLDELNKVAKYEFTHVEDDWPHQGLRLERMRTEIEREKFGVRKEDPFPKAGIQIERPPIEEQNDASKSSESG